MRKYIVTTNVKTRIGEIGVGRESEYNRVPTPFDDMEINGVLLSGMSPAELRSARFSHDEWRNYIFGDDPDNEGILNFARSIPDCDNKFTVRIYITAEFWANPQEATPIFADSKWQSEWLKEEFGENYLIADKEDEKK